MKGYDKFASEKSTDNWSEEELEASVRAYFKMRDLQMRVKNS